MTLPRTGARIVAAACALSLVLSACGGDDDDSSDVSEETTEATAGDESTTEAADDGSSTTKAGDDGSSTTAAEEPTTGRSEEEAQAIVDAINLTIDDFAEGWTATEQDDSDEGDLDSCFQEVDVNASAIVEGETPQFSAETGDGMGQIVNMQTVVFDSPETAQAVVAETASDEFNGCAEGIFLTSFNMDGGNVTVDLAQSPDDPPLTEESVGIVGAIVGTLADGSDIDGLVDLHVFRTADVVSFTLVLDVGDVAFQDTLQGLYTEIATRHATEVS